MKCHISLCLPVRRVCDGGNRGNRIATELYTEDSEGSDYRMEREGKMRRKTEREGEREGGEGGGGGWARNKSFIFHHLLLLLCVCVSCCVCHIVSPPVVELQMLNSGL